MSKILVMGAAGKTGRRVKERLENLNIDVRPGSRTAQIPFDWQKPETWAKALDGISKVYITFQPDLAVPTARATIQEFVAQAKKAGVDKLVLLSGRGEKEAESCEKEVVGSGIDFSIVRASWFMQNFSENFLAEGILQGALVVPEVNALEPFVDAEDIADVVVECLFDSIHSNKTYSLTGPELLSFRQGVELISGITNQPIAYMEIPLSSYTEAMRQKGYPEDVIWLVEYLFTEVLDGRNEFLTRDIEDVLGRKPRSFQEYASATATSGAWKTVQI